MTAATNTEKGVGHHGRRNSLHQPRTGQENYRHAQQSLDFGSCRNDRPDGRAYLADQKGCRPAAALGQWQREREAQAARVRNSYTASCGRNYHPAETAAAKDLQAAARPRRWLRRLPRRLLPLPGLLLL